MSEAKYHSKLPMMAGKGNIRVVLVDSDQEWGRRFTEFLKTATDIHLINISVTKEEAVRAGLGECPKQQLNRRLFQTDPKAPRRTESGSCHSPSHFTDRICDAPGSCRLPTCRTNYVSRVYN